jgi:hypothetical protein
MYMLAHERVRYVAMHAAIAAETKTRCWDERYRRELAVARRI